MGFAAHATGHGRSNISAWYLDSASRRIVTLQGQGTPVDIFSLKIAEYLECYGRSIKKAAPIPTLQEIAYVNAMARQPAVAASLINAIRDSRDFRQITKHDTTRITLDNPQLGWREPLELAQKAGLIRAYEFRAGADQFLSFKLVDPRWTIRRRQSFCTAHGWKCMCG